MIAVLGDGSTNSISYPSGASMKMKQLREAVRVGPSVILIRLAPSTRIVQLLHLHGFTALKVTICMTHAPALDRGAVAR
jgi:hypothetical protein